MTRAEKRVIGECLRAAAFGPCFRRPVRHPGDHPYALIHTLMGITHQRLVEIARAFPAVDGEDPDVISAIVGSMNSLTGYPHGEDRAWRRYLTTSSKHVAELLDRWQDLEAYEREGDHHEPTTPP